MADAPNPTPSPASEAAASMGGMMMGESPPFPTDEHTTNQPDEIASIFGLGEEAGPVPNSSESSPDGGASPSGATPAAEGGEGQATQPATPPAPQPQPGQQGTQPQAPTQPAPAPQPAPVEPPAAPAPQAGDDPRVAALTAQVQALSALVGQLQAGQQPQGGGQQTPQPAPDGSGQPQPQADPNMDYRLGIPDDVAGAIFNEDPAVARQGLTHLINSFGRIVHERVLRSVDSVLQQRLPAFAQELTLTQQQEQMRNQYFAANPAHNEPGIKLIVAQEAQAMWTAQPTLGWDANSMAALAQRVNARLGAVPLQPQPQGQQPPAPAPVTPAPRPAAQMGASNRPPADPADNSGTFIMDVLSAG